MYPAVVTPKRLTARALPGEQARRWPHGDAEVIVTEARQLATGFAIAYVGQLTRASPPTPSVPRSRGEALPVVAPRASQCSLPPLLRTSAAHKTPRSAVRLVVGTSLRERPSLCSALRPRASSARRRYRLIGDTQSWSTSLVLVSSLVTRPVHRTSVQQSLTNDVQPGTLDVRPPALLPEADAAIEKYGLRVEFDHRRNVCLVDEILVRFAQASDGPVWLLGSTAAGECANAGVGVEEGSQLLPVLRSVSRQTGLCDF